jgi:hypothetical protein
MSTSGSTDFNLTRDELLTGALRLIGKAGRGKTPSAADISDAAEALELMVKQLQTTGVHLWKQQDATLFLDSGTQSYSLPGANMTLDYITTSMKVAGSATDLTIDVNSISGLTTGDFIGIELDNGTMQWTTINGAPSGDTVTITDALTGSAAISNTVYAYTTKIVRPLKALSARRQGTNDVDIDVVSREEYFRLPVKSSTGQVNTVYYDPQLTTAKLYVWPTGDKADDRLQVTFMMPIEDFDSSNINPDFPQEWLLALKYGVASLLGPEYGLDLNRQMYIDSRAAAFMESAVTFDEEYASVYFTVEN